MNKGPPTGEYVISRHMDNAHEREDCKLLLKRNGCRAVRFERQYNGTHSDGTDSVLLVAHGYLAQLAGAGIEAL